MSYTLLRENFAKICRTCVKIQADMLNINDDDILIMFTTCTSVKIAVDDDFPHTICLQCIEKIKAAYAFNLQCEESYNKLKEIKYQENISDAKTEIIEEDGEPQHDEVDFKESETDFKDNLSECIDNPSNGPSSDEEESPAIVDPAKLFPTPSKHVKRVKYLDETKCDREQIKCLVCQKQFANLFCLARHLDQHDENRQFVCYCEVCKKGFYERGHLTKHMRRHKGETRYQCEHCAKNFYELSALAVHTKIHNVDPISCEECGKEFMVKLQLEIHKKLHVNEIIKCDQCDKTFKNGFYLKSHQITHVKERRLFCQFCDKSFKVLSALKTHHQRNHVQKRERSACNICGKFVIDLKSHLTIHRPNNIYKCEECPKEFRSKFNFMEHKKRKHGSPDEASKRPYLCSICGKGIITTTALKSHYQHMHSTEKPYVCSICYKAFKTEYTLNIHVRYRHNNERRHQCKVCMKSFQTSSVLKLHTRVHTGERPYSCKMCDKAFGQSSALNTHLKKVHGCDRKSRVVDGGDLKKKIGPTD